MAASVSVRCKEVGKLLFQRHGPTTSKIQAPMIFYKMDEPSRLFAACLSSVHCSVVLDLHPAIPECCCSCCKQHILVPTLATACSPLDAGQTTSRLTDMTDQQQILGRQNVRPWAKINKKLILWHQLLQYRLLSVRVPGCQKLQVTT